METVSVKFQEDILKKIDTSISQHNFNSRTEFIRDAVRDKLSELSRDELIEEFMKFKGKAKKKTTDEDLKKIRAEVSQELMEELDKKFS
ncbi:MAG: ribbon-helix-helix domain-containing protein [Nanoarchaeota archaeon]